LEGVWEGNNEEKSYTFFRASYDGQDFAVFAKDSLDTNTWGVTDGKYSLDAEICPDSIEEDRTIIIGGEKFCTTIYNAESTETTKTFPPPVTKLSRKEKLKVSVDFTEYSYPQPCLQNFYCGYGATSPSGTGKCPKGQFCPSPKSIFEAFDEELVAYVGRDLPDIQSCALFDCGQNLKCDTHEWYRGEKSCSEYMEASPECPMNHLDCPVCDSWPDTPDEDDRKKKRCLCPGRFCPEECPLCLRDPLISINNVTELRSACKQLGAEKLTYRPVKSVLQLPLPIVDTITMQRCLKAKGVASGKNYSTGRDTIDAPYARRGRASTTLGRSLDQTCTPGTYGPITGLKECRRCPAGQKCPNSRMYEGIPCKSGFICQLDVCELYPVEISEVKPLNPNDERTCYGEMFYEMSVDCNVYDKTACNEPDMLPCKWMAQVGKCEHVSLCWTCNAACSQCAPAFSGEQIQCLKGHYCEEGTNTILPGQGVDPGHKPGYSGSARNVQHNPGRDGFAFKGPMPCPNGTFCLPGVFTNEYNGEKQGEAGWPQLCTPGYFCQPGVGLCRVEAINPITNEIYTQYGCSTQKGSGLCPAGTFCPRGSTDPTPAIPGTHVPRAGASTPVDCPTGRFSMSTGAEICETCPAGRYNDETRQSECKTCQKGRFMELSYAVTGKEIRCQDCPRGTYYDLEGSNSSLTCKPTPSGFFCNLLGQTDCFKRVLPDGQTTNCKECQEGFLCPAGTNEYIDSMKCPAGFYCGLGTYSGILFGTQPGDKPGSRFFKEVADDCLEVEFKSVHLSKPRKYRKLGPSMNSQLCKNRENLACVQKTFIAQEEP
jgi:hypothetical protein